MSHLTITLVETAHAFPEATIVPLHAEGWAHFTRARMILPWPSRRSASDRGCGCSSRA
jgi:hypothetical protein